ncbi:MAG: FtsX-like permease family protein [Gemmatimonadota bacterium]
MRPTLAREYWPDRSPIGQRIRGTTNDRYMEWMTVVGVVEDVRHASVLADPEPELYVSAIQRPNRASYTTLTIEAERDPAALAGAVRDAIRRVAPQVPADLETFDSIAARDIADRRFAMVLISGFALMALLLAAIGIYGVVSYTVGRRTREIGIRMALGAEPGRVMLGVQREMMIPVALGAVVGVVAAVLLSRLARGLLFGVDPLDVGTFAGVTLILLAVASVAAYLPARRSARVDPVEALAAE